MTETEPATCQACGWHGPVDEALELRDLWDRVQPGDVMPAGECPLEGCRGAAMLDDRYRRQDDLRPPLVALTIGLDRLHESLLSGSVRPPVHSHIRELAEYARKALDAGAPLQPVCNTCGSTRVLVDAWAEWDTEAQRWELHSTYEATAICGECDTECSYTMQALADHAA